MTGGGIADGARLIERGTGGDLRQFGQNILTQRHGDSLSDVGGNMLSDQLNGTQRIPVRRLDRVHLKRNIGGAGQHAVLRQGGNNMLRIANVGIQLLQIVGDTVTFYRMTRRPVLSCLLAQTGLGDLQGVGVTVGDEGCARGEDPRRNAVRQRRRPGRRQ